MAKAVANCICKTCGKEFKFTKILRNCTEANKFKSWAEENIIECEECRKERTYLSHKHENAVAIENSNKRGWPELTGTTKQVEWASSIREKEMSPIIKIIEDNGNYPKIEQYRNAADRMLGHTRADWWISNKGFILSIFQAEVRSSI